MSEVIVITSGKGGVGKTTTVANIGTGLAMLGKKLLWLIQISVCGIWMLFWAWRTGLSIIWWMSLTEAAVCDRL